MHTRTHSSQHWKWIKSFHQSCPKTYVYIYVTLSVKTQLKSFFCDFAVFYKKNNSYGKEHSVKMLHLYL